SRRGRHRILVGDWSPDLCSSDLRTLPGRPRPDFLVQAIVYIAEVVPDDGIRLAVGQGRGLFQPLARPLDLPPPEEHPAQAVQVRSEERRVGKECKAGGVRSE